MLPVHTDFLLEELPGDALFFPGSGALNIQTTQRSLNQMWKAIRWDVEYVPPHSSSADGLDSNGPAASVAHCPLQATRKNLPALQLLWN